MTRYVTFGEIMLRLSTPGYRRYAQAMPGTLDIHFGGAEASVAGLLAHWGCQASYVTALPDNALGHACIANLRYLGADTNSIVLREDSRLGLYFVEHGVNQRFGQVIYDRADSAFAVTPPEQYDWDSILDGADWFLTSGITPAVSRNGCEVAFDAIDHAVRRNIRIACDVNFRSKLWRWDPSKEPQQLAAETMQRMVPNADLLVCGRGDAIDILGIPKDVSNENLPRELATRYPKLKHIAMTRRQSQSYNDQEFGASLFDVASDTLYHAPAAEQCYRIGDVVDRIGTGDAFTGALLYALENREWRAPEKAIRWATAAACLAHSIEGDFSLISTDEVQALTEGRGIGYMIR